MVTVKQIPLDRSNLVRFTHFQIDLYKGNQYYVPPLVIDDVNTLTPSKNPASEFCESACFMAYDAAGKPVGRIAAIINRAVNERKDAREVRFGWFDFIDSHEVSEALIKAAVDWGRERGMNKIVGPLGFTDLDHEGMLTFGYEELGTMATIYNYPYYVEHMERLGFRKEVEWLEYVMDVPDAIPERYNRIADIVKKKFGLRVLKYTSKKKVRRDYGHELFRLINEAYDKLYGYSPLTDRQIDYYVAQYIPLLDLKLVTLVVDSDNRLVGVGLSMPSMSRGLQKSRGRLLPFGWIPLLKGLKGKNDRVDLLLVAVKPEYQSKGVNALLFQDLIPQYIAKGYKWAESNPEMAANSKVQSQWEYFERRQHRRRAAFSKDI